MRHSACNVCTAASHNKKSCVVGSQSPMARKLNVSAATSSARTAAMSASRNGSEERGMVEGVRRAQAVDSEAVQTVDSAAAGEDFTSLCG